MTNPLTTLDEIIWKQFEKVTTAAYKRYGWDKWDLVRITSTLAAGSFIGFGTYMTLTGVYGHSFANIATGSLCALVGGIFYQVNSDNLKVEKEEEERTITRTRAVPSPRFYFFRPAWLATSLGLLLGTAGYLLKGEHKAPPSLSSLSVHQYKTISALTMSMGGLSNLFLVCSSYFKSQLPRPPSSKKSLWKALTEYVTKPFHKEIPTPAELPVAKYYSTPYSTPESLESTIHQQRREKVGL